MEEWKDIEGYPNYMVSNLGRVKSLERNIVRGRGGLYKIEEKILKSVKNTWGYLFVNLYNEGKIKKYLIHRIVAQAFLPNHDNLQQINHRNEDKTDNRVENLEWCDSKYNINYGTHNKKMAKSKSIPILQFTKEMELVRKWESAMDVERELGFNQSSICSCCKGKYKSAYGYKWGYEKDYERIPFNVFDLEIYRKIA